MAGMLISESMRVARLGGAGIIAGAAIVVIGRAMGSTIGFAFVIAGTAVVVAGLGVLVAQTVERLIDRRHRRELLAFSPRGRSGGRTRVLQRCDICGRPKVDLGGAWICAVCDQPRR